VAKREGPRAQRASCQYDELGRAWVLPSGVDTTVGHADTVPVLVVPEAAVKGCEHYDDEVAKRGKALEEMGAAWCVECGSWWDGTRWIKPRILRVARRTT
jgi:hypothetical protein